MLTPSVRSALLLLLAVCVLPAMGVSQTGGPTTGLFSTMAPVPFAPWGWPDTGDVGDFNGDGHPDVLYSHISGYMLIAGDGQGNPVSATLLPTPAILQSGLPIGIPDLDGNGLRDIFDVSGCVRLNFLGGGVPVQYQLPATLVSGNAVVSDLDQDGWVEAVSTGSAVPPNTVTPFRLAVHSLRLNGPILLFEYFDSNLLIGAEVADFNGDGLPDITISRLLGFTLDQLVFHQTAAGMFVLAYVENAIQSQYSRSLTGDINGDGLKDIVIFGPSPIAGRVAVRLLNTGSGFTVLPELAPAEVQNSAGWGLNGAALADFDGDGCDDLMSRGRIFRLDPAYDGLPPMYSDPQKIVFDPSFQTCAPECCTARSGDMNLDGAPDIIFTCALPGISHAHSAISLNLREHRPACPSGPTLYMGTPAIGNAQFFVAAFGAPPLVPALLGISLGESNVTWGTGCQLGPDPDPALLLLPAGPFGITTTDPIGVASIALPLPQDPALRGVGVYAQWIIQHPAPGAPFTIGGTPWTLSNSRYIVFW